ncbi:MAG: membrane protein insertase YidC [Buchananella hordeovulneris]|nr:membrane protein insertase YidC [Buchananella hordeovulneris]
MDTILKPIMYVVAWIMVKLHDLFALVLGDGSSWAWVLAIVGLTIVVRIALIPLFFRQIKASRGMQIMQPELKKLQEKYKGRKDPASQQAMQQEMMALYKKHGTNPFSSCMPLLLQMPVFFALFRVLNNAGAIAAGTANPIGPLTKEVAAKVQEASLFGAKLSETFLSSGDTQVKIITVVLIVAMSLSQFLTMRQLTMKNMPASATSGENPMMRQQKIMMYLFPLIFAVTGINFQIGVLIYWLTSNLWTGGQQWYAIRRMPAPGSEAERAMKERIRAKRIAKGLPPETEEEIAAREEAEARQGQRVQPVRKSRQKAHGPLSGSVKELLEEGEEEAQDVRDAGGLTPAEREMKRYQDRMARRRASKKK